MNDLLEIRSDILVNENPLDLVEKEMLHMDQIEFDVSHEFVPGYYLRVFRATAGSRIISKIHKTLHSFSISKGVVSVWDETNGWRTLVAPYNGITKPGTRRALVVHEDLVWTTAHPMNETDLDVIEDILIDNRENPLLSESEQHILNQIKQFHAMKPTNIIEEEKQ